MPQSKASTSSVTVAKGHAYMDTSLPHKLQGGMHFAGNKRSLKYTRCVPSLQVFKTLRSSWIYLLCLMLILSYLGATIYHVVCLHSSLKSLTHYYPHHCIFLIIPLDSCNPFLESWNPGICTWCNSYLCCCNDFLPVSWFKSAQFN